MSWDTWEETTAGFLAVEFPATPWLIHGLIPGAGWTLIESEPGVGKSMFAFQVVECLAQGPGAHLLDYAQPRKIYRCAYIQVDEPTAEWQAQMTSMQARNIPLLLATDPDINPLSDPAARVKIRERLRAFGTDFVVWDSAYALSRYDLNTADGVARLLHGLREMHTGPFMLLHHTRKPGRDQERTDSVVTAGYGSIFLSANASAVLRLLPDRLEVGKTRLAKNRSRVLGRDDDAPGRGNTGRWIVPPPGPKAPDGGQWDKALQAPQRAPSAGNRLPAAWAPRLPK